MPLVNGVWKGPLPGRYFNYALPVRIDKTSRTDPIEAPDGSTRLGLLRFEAANIKEPVAKFLGLLRYPSRTGVFKESATSTNSGRMFAIRGTRGAQTYKLILKRGTQITIDAALAGAASPSILPVTVRTISISLPSTVKVQEVRQWLQKGLVISDPTSDITEGTTQPWFKSVVGFITPRDITYNLFEEVGDQYQPQVIGPGIQNPMNPENPAASPSPSPNPTP